MVQDNKYWIDLLDNQTEDVTTDPVRSQIGDLTVFAYGNFDGAQAKIQISPDDVMNTTLYPLGPDEAEWFDSPDATFTDKAMINADLGEVWFRAVLTGSTINTEVSLKLRPRVEEVT